MAGFKSFLSAVGHGFQAAFGWLGSKQGQDTIQGAEVLAAGIGTAIGGPGLGAAIAGVEVLINRGLQQVISVEAGAAAVGAQSGTGAQKAAAVVAYLTPQAHDTLVALNVAEPTAEQVQTLAKAISEGLVGILNAIPAPTQPAA